MTEQPYQTIIAETREDGVGLVTLNRPEALNALNTQLVDELADALEAFEADPAVGCVVLTGSERAFAAGADIREMSDPAFPDLFTEEYLSAAWARVAAREKPLIAAVAGYALGGGCELAMMCDMIVCTDNAKFGQPEITLGILPGIGGTQRLARAVGKAKAMDMILTGRTMDAAEAERAGLVARIVAADDLLLDEALEMARTIAGQSRPAVTLAKKAVDQAFELPLAGGLRLEQCHFQAAFSTEDCKEGMAAFLEKRKPAFKHK